jgi:thioredoxin
LFDVKAKNRQLFYKADVINFGLKSHNKLYMKIKNYISALMLVMVPLMSNCQGPAAKKVEDKKQDQTVVEHLTKLTFKQKVFDYEANKQWKYAGNLPCIIDFYADWCGPCKRLAPTVEQIAKDYKGKIKVYKVNVDEQQELAGAFGIQGIPAVLFCPQTEKPQMSTGYISRADFDKAIKDVLKVQ